MAKVSDCLHQASEWEFTGKRTSRDWKDVIVMSSRIDSVMVASLGEMV